MAKYEVKPFADSFKGTRLLEHIQHFVEKQVRKLGSVAIQQAYILYIIDTDTINHNTFSQFLSAQPDVQKKFLGLKQDVYSHFFFLSKSNSFISWTDEHNPAHSNLKECEFYVRLFASYQLGNFVHYENMEEELEKEHGELATRLMRLIYYNENDHGKKKKREIALQNHLQMVKQDAIKLYTIAQKEEESKIALQEKSISSVSDDELSAFFTELSILYQLGRRPYVDTDRATSELEWLKDYNGSFGLKQKINAALQAKNSGGQAPELREMLARLRKYEILRDLGRWMVSGADYWLQDFDDQDQFKVLIIDEIQEKNSSDSAEPYLNYLKNIYEAFKDENKNKFHIDRISTSASQFWEDLRSYGSGGKKLSFKPLFGNGKACEHLDEYHAILVEVEFSEAYLGPSIVQTLANLLDYDKNVKYRPKIIIFSRKDNFGPIQQCLGLGADESITKERTYSLPARLVQLHAPGKLEEPRGSKSNFRSLYQLQAKDIVKLRSKYIYGLPWDDIEQTWIKSLPKADLHTHIGTCISLPTIEALAFNTIGYLLDHSESQGHRPASKQGKINKGINQRAEEVIELVCQVVIWSGVLNKVQNQRTGGSRYSPARVLWEATNAVLQLHGREKISETLPREAIYDKIVQHLTKQDIPIASFEVCSLLVASLCLLGGTAQEDALFSLNSSKSLDRVKCRITDEWSYVEELQEWDDELNKNKSPDEDLTLIRIWINSLLSNTLDHCRTITGIDWRHRLTQKRSAENFVDTEKPWKRCFDKTTARTKGSIDVLYHHCEIAFKNLRDLLITSKRGSWEDEPLLSESRVSLTRMNWPPDPAMFEALSLSELIELPDTTSRGRDFNVDREQSLSRYLWGAGLLGAVHLQYPENLLLAANDVVAQSISDNITYSEIRCAPTGYSLGGMSTVDATDLLCYSFDMATAFHALKRKERWVRTNILLSAKRHKEKEEFRDIVSLLEYQLQKGERRVYAKEDFIQANLGRLVPKWWKPCRVVGFDLSGDESTRAQHIADMMTPLLRLAAPITIHAGEAATAENIWGAVYNFGARRIGHGLRLRENTRLLNYCVKERVCIELCPISNQYTNEFIDVETVKFYDSSLRTHYPLRHNLAEGLDVCINTDNRQLHGGKTLTDEYMCAARMSGGLTQWEILKLIKSGFKHAFLLKSEVELFLSAMEDEVYRFVIESHK